MEIVELTQPHLSKSLATKLVDNLETLPNFKTATIINPVHVEQLPHLTTVQQMKLSGLPSKCDDWIWLRDMNNLEVLELELGDQSNGKDDQTLQSTLLVCDKKSTIAIRDSETTQAFGQVLTYLPEHMTRAVSHNTLSSTF